MNLNFCSSCGCNDCLDVHGDISPNPHDEFKMLLAAIGRAYHEMNGDYVDEVWGRRLNYLSEILERHDVPYEPRKN